MATVPRALPNGDASTCNEYRTDWLKSVPKKALKGPEIQPNSPVFVLSVHSNSLTQEILGESASISDDQQADFTSASGKTYGDLEASSSSDRAASTNRIVSGASTSRGG